MAYQLPPPKPDLPDLDLAPLQEFHVDTFQSGDAEADGFFLMLALAYNDLKAAKWMELQLFKGNAPRSNDVPDGYQGQINGLIEWTRRQSIAIVHQVIELVDKHADLRSRPIFERVLSKVGSRSLESWRHIEAAAGAREERSGFPGFLMKVRHNIAHHYHQPKQLLKGYHHHFKVAEPSPTNRAAFASLGNQMESSSFYFADAAAQAFVRNVAGAGITPEELTAHLERVNYSLRFVVEAYLRVRAEDIRNAKTAAAPSGE